MGCCTAGKEREVEYQPESPAPQPRSASDEPHSGGKHNLAKKRPSEPSTTVGNPATPESMDREDVAPHSGRLKRASVWSIKDRPVDVVQALRSNFTAVGDDQSQLISEFIGWGVWSLLEKHSGELQSILLDTVGSGVWIEIQYSLHELLVNSLCAQTTSCVLDLTGGTKLESKQFDRLLDATLGLVNEQDPELRLQSLFELASHGQDQIDQNELCKFVNRLLVNLVAIAELLLKDPVPTNRTEVLERALTNLVAQDGTDDLVCTMRFKDLVGQLIDRISKTQLYTQLHHLMQNRKLGVACEIEAGRVEAELYIDAVTHACQPISQPVHLDEFCSMVSDLLLLKVNHTLVCLSQLQGGSGLVGSLEQCLSDLLSEITTQLQLDQVRTQVCTALFCTINHEEHMPCEAFEQVICAFDHRKSTQLRIDCLFHSTFGVMDMIDDAEFYDMIWHCVETGRVALHSLVQATLCVLEEGAAEQLIRLAVQKSMTDQDTQVCGSQDFVEGFKLLEEDFSRVWHFMCNSA